MGIFTMEEKKVSIIIPAYNEEKTIADIISRIQGLYPFAEIIVINDGSTDNTAAAALKSGVKVYNHPYNIGNGAAVKSGIRAATGDILVLMDGDGQHNPEDIGVMLACFPEFDMVVGARSHKGQASFGRAFGNTIYNWFASYVTKFSVKDLTSGFRAVKADIARNFLYLLPNTYSYPTTITLGVLRNGNSVKYIPIWVQKRQNGHSRIKFFQDGIRFFMIITRIATMYSPMRVFLPVSFTMFLLGLLRYGFTFFSEGRFTNMSALFFVTSVIIFMMSLISEQVCQMRYERRAVPRATQQVDSNKVLDNQGVAN
jgi:glycosyltransferase involved in cell wall biosynthesis